MIAESELKIWAMSVSCEQDRPQIDLEDHDLKSEDWGDIEREFPPGVDVIPSPPTLRFHVDDHATVLLSISHRISWVIKVIRND